MAWKIIFGYYLGACLTFITFLAAAWWAGLIFDKNRNLIKKNLIVHIIVFLIAFVGATIFISKDLENLNKETVSEAKLKYSGVLTPESKTLFHYKDSILSKLEIGWTFYNHGIYIEYEGKLLDSKAFGSKSSPLMRAIEDISLRVEKELGQVKASTLIRDKTGDVVAQIIDNEWKVAHPPKTFDRNYTKDMLEVINSKGEVVLQIRALEDRIQLNGIFYCAEGNGVEIIPPSTIHLLGKTSPPFNKIRPIFKYPSELHLGELRYPSINVALDDIFVESNKIVQRSKIFNNSEIMAYNLSYLLTYIYVNEHETHFATDLSPIFDGENKQKLSIFKEEFEGMLLCEIDHTRFLPRNHNLDTLKYALFFVKLIVPNDKKYSYVPFGYLLKNQYATNLSNNTMKFWQELDLYSTKELIKLLVKWIETNSNIEYKPIIQKFFEDYAEYHVYKTLKTNRRN